MSVSGNFFDSGGTPSGATDDTLGRIARAGLWSVLAHGFGAGSVFLVSIVIGRALGPAELGRYSYYMWILRIAPVLIGIGIPTAITRLVSEKDGAGQLGQARSLFLLVRRFHLVLILIPTAVLVALAGVGQVAWLGLLLCLGIAVGLLALDHEALLAGLRRFRDLSLLAGLMGILQVTAAVVGLAAGADWQGFLLLFVVAAGIGLAAMAGVSQRWIRAGEPEPLPSPERKRFVRFAWAVALAATAEAFLWGRPELIFLERYRPDADLGFYTTALRLSSLASMIPLVASRSLLPEFSNQLGAGRTAELQQTFRNVCRLLMVVSAPLALGGLAVAGGLVTSFYGPQFAPAATATAILLVGSLVNALAGPSAAAVFTGPRPRLVAEVGIVAVALNAALDVIFIPRYGAVGAAIINVTVQALSVTVGMAYSWVKLGLRYPVVEGLRVLALAAMAAGVAYLVTVAVPGTWGVAAAVAAGALTYSGLLITTGTLRLVELKRMVGMGVA